MTGAEDTHRGIGMRLERRTDAASWRDTAELLRWLAEAGRADEYMAGESDGEGARWFGWEVGADGELRVSPVGGRMMLSVGQWGPAMQRAAALTGHLCGLGVASPVAGSVWLTVYSPPAWPEVPDGAGGYRRVAVEWPDDDALWAALE